jgi:hypothetical protein
VLVLGSANEPSVGSHKLNRSEVVDREAEPPLQSTHPASERQPGDSRVRDDADRTDQPVGLSRFVQLGEEGAAVHTGRAPFRIDLGSPHRGEVDHDPVVAGREPGDAVTAAPDCDHELLLAREAKRRSDVVDAGRAGDDRGPSVEDPVPDGASLVVPGVGREDDLAGEGLAE